jgi:hypothetical protein
MNLPRLLMKLGNLCFFLILIPVVGLFANLFWYGAKSEYSFEEIMEVPFFQMGFWLILIILFAVGAAILYPASIIAGKMAYQNIVETGQDAEAKILALTDTGTRINRNPLVKFSLEVQPPNQPSFRAETRTTISVVEIPSFQPGNIVRVKYVPGTDKVVIIGAKQ